MRKLVYNSIILYISVLLSSLSVDFSTLSDVYFDSVKVDKVYYDGSLIWQSKVDINYIVDGTTYTERVVKGASALSPKTFTPTKSGWTFVGWREDKTANSTVLTSKVAETKTTLYAVFKQAVTVTYYNNSTTASSTSGYRYYNTGNVVNPSFKLTQATSSGWTARGWSTTNKGSASITYANGASFTRDSNITLYGLYQQTITLSYNANGGTGTVASQTGTRYWAPAGAINPSFTLKANAFTKSNCSFNKWASGSASGTQYAAGASVTLASNTTFYAVWNTVTPFTLNLSSYPISKTGSGGAVIMTNCYGPYTITCDGGSCDFTYRWVSASTGAIPTNKCNKVKVTYYTLHANRDDQKMYINGVDVSRKGDSSSKATLVLSCGSTFTLSMTCESNSYGADLVVTDLYFYYE